MAPWVTIGLLKSNEKNRLFKLLQRDPTNVELKREYTSYGNLLNSLKTRSKYKFYKAEIANNPSDTKKHS